MAGLLDLAADPAYAGILGNAFPELRPHGQAPGQGGFMGGMSNFLGNNSPMLMAMGAGLMSGRGFGGGLQMGMEAQQQQQADALKRAMLLYGINRDNRDFGFRQTEAQRAQQNTDRGFGFQQSEAQRAQGNVDRTFTHADAPRIAAEDYLKSSGMAPDPNLAKAVAGNPALLSGVIGNQLVKTPEFTKIGTDSMGRENYGFVDKARGTVTPIGQPGAGASPVDNANGLAGEDYLKTLDTPTANTVRGILEGRMQPPTSFAASKPYWQGILQHAANAEPGFDLTRWQGRVGTAKDFASGPAAKNVTSLNTVIGHMGDLADAFDKLGNRSMPLWNSIANTVESGRGEPALKSFEVARNAVADEMAKVFRSSGMSDTEIHAWKDTISSSNSPDQARAVIKRGLGLLESRVEALKDQYRRGAGKDSPELFSQKSQGTLEKIGKWVNGAPMNATAPSSAPGSALPPGWSVEAR